VVRAVLTRAIPEVRGETLERKRAPEGALSKPLCAVRS
jgi:hypothetical protein